MWKYYRRTLKETFERTVGLTKSDKLGQDYNSIVCVLNLNNSSVLQKYNLYTTSEEYDTTSNRERKEKSHRNGKFWDRRISSVENPCLGLLGWSTTVLMGWYMCQPLCRMGVFPTEDDKRQKRQYRYVSLAQIVSKTAHAQPDGEDCPDGVKFKPLKVETKQACTQTDDDTLIEQSKKVYPGPPTAEQAVDEAAENLAKVQDTVLADIDNKLGVHFMQHGRHKEAVLHFNKAMQLKSTPAAYNLGICYEKGLGITEDLKKAARCYIIASERGHVNAMYNLGVFYAQGLGGLPTDVTKARQLFEQAANLGQNEAKKALELLPIPEPPVQEEQVVGKLINIMQLYLYKNQNADAQTNITCDEETETDSSVEYSDVYLTPSNKNYIVQLFQKTLVKYTQMQC